MSALIVENIALADQQQHAEKVFPLALQCLTADAQLSDVQQWIQADLTNLESKLNQHGAILFRGFPLRSADSFDAFITAFGFPNFPYDQSLSNAVRINRTARVFTANEAPAEVTIRLHHEMAQTPIYPSKLFFFCQQSPELGGATPICRSDVLLQQLSQQAPGFVHDCQEKGLQYMHVMPAEADLQSGMGRSWQSTFQVVEREQAEQRMAKLGYSWQWLADGSLRATTPVLPAVRELVSGKQSFFNQLIAFAQTGLESRDDSSLAITLGDGSPLDAEAVLLASELSEELTFDIPWQPGDVALLDNFAVMHGRRNFQGTRQVLASLVAA